jgi:hypothetical protein
MISVCRFQIVDLISKLSLIQFWNLQSEILNLKLFLLSFPF